MSRFAVGTRSDDTGFYDIMSLYKNMAKKPMQKPVKARCLGRKIHPIFVLNNERLQPYAELFLYEGENIIQKPLGTLFGIFKINDTSVDSGYVVNFLASVLRREFFSNPRRIPSASLESALNKVNVALSELAKQGNINWLGNMELVVCVIENDNLHFSVSGKSYIFLLRNQTITEISRGLYPEEDSPHPLRTFTDLSSGRIQQGDRIIISTRELLDLFPAEKLQRESSRFDSEDFRRFVHTALVNEFDLAATILMDFFEEKRSTTIQIANKQKKQITESMSANVFSKNAFVPVATHSEQTTDEEKETTLRNGTGYTDKKTGHIYIQQTDEITTSGNQNFIQKKFPIWKEHILDAFEKIHSWNSTFWRRTRNDIVHFFIWSMTRVKEEFLVWKKKRSEKLMVEKTAAESKIPKEEMPLKQKLSEQTDKMTLDRRYYESNEFESFPDRRGSTFFSTFFLKTISLARLIFGWFLILIRRIVPNIGKIKSLFFSLNWKQKLIALACIAAIVLIPLLFSKKDPEATQKAPQETPKVESSALNTPRPKYADEKNFSPVATSSLKQIPIGTNTRSKQILALNDGLALVGRSAILLSSASEVKTVRPPSDVVISPEQTSYMSDLDLIFIPTNANTLYAFNPTTQKFAKNVIDLKAQIPSFFFTTYLTYLYALNKNDGSITRYPRSAENGFGDGSSWLKEESDFQKVTDFTSDGSLYIANGETILKYFKNKKEIFSPEKTNVPFHFDRISTLEESDPLVALDKKQNRIIEYDKTGSIMKQYVLEGEEKAIDIALTKDSLGILFESGKAAIRER